MTFKLGKCSSKNSLKNEKRKGYLKPSIEVSNELLLRLVVVVSSKTVSKLYQKLKYLNCTFYTDDWESFSKILPKEKHLIGKHTITIEQDSSNTRYNWLE